MGLTGADEIAASVQIEKGPVRPRILQIDPFGGYAESVDRGCQHPLGHGEETLPAAVHSLTLVGNGAVEREAAVACAKVEFEYLTAYAWHVGHDGFFLVADEDSP